jgi:hypothetical protein
MPDWWRVVNMEYIASAQNAYWVIVPFLASNISYFWSGIYLMNKFNLVTLHNHGPRLARSTANTGSTTTTAGADDSEVSSVDGLHSPTTTDDNKNNHNNNNSMRYWRRGSVQINPNRFAMLGVWVCLAGLISTIFHSVQALGSHALAESLCYIDHAVAISAILYFIDTCGIPSKLVSTIGTVAIGTLVITPTPGYAWLHSTWHYLSALAATKWAIEGHYNYQTNQNPSIIHHDHQQQNNQ